MGNNCCSSEAALNADHNQGERVIKPEQRTLQSSMATGGNLKSTMIETGHSSPTSFNSSVSRDTYQLQNAKIAEIKQKDIEEEDYIYAVPCDPRQTISLRDSVKLNRASPKTIAKQNKKKTQNANNEKEIMLEDISAKPSQVHVSERELQPTKLNNPIPRKGTFTKKNLNIAIPTDEHGNVEQHEEQHEGQEEEEEEEGLELDNSNDQDQNRTLSNYDPLLGKSVNISQAPIKVETSHLSMHSARSSNNTSVQLGNVTHIIDDTESNGTDIQRMILDGGSPNASRAGTIITRMRGDTTTSGYSETMTQIQKIEDDEEEIERNKEENYLRQLNTPQSQQNAQPQQQVPSKSRPKSSKGKDTKSRLTAKLEQIREGGAQRDTSKGVDVQSNGGSDMGFDQDNYREERADTMQVIKKGAANANRGNRATMKQNENSLSVRSGGSGNMGLRADYKDSEDGASDVHSTYKYFDDMESNDGGDRRVSAWVNNDPMGDGEDDYRNDSDDDDAPARGGAKLNNKQRRETYRDY